MSLSEYVRREDLKSLYALPMKEASKKLGVSESSLRNICRKHNIERWPYRKFQQLDAHIASLQNVEASQQSAQQREMIESLLRARSILEENPNMTCEMAILQANKQIMSNNPNASSQDMTAVMMMMMMNSASQEDSSPTISSCAESVAQSSSQMNPSNNHHAQNGANFVPIYPVHVTSHLSASAALSAMARRKKPTHGELISPTPSNNNMIHNSNIPNLNNNNGWNSSSMMTMGQRSMPQQQQPNQHMIDPTAMLKQHVNTRFTDTELMQSYATINNGNIPIMIIDPHQQQQQQQHHSPQLNSPFSQEFSERRFAVSHRDSVALKSGFLTPTQNYPVNGNNAFMMNNNNTTLPYGVAPMDENENVMMDSNAGEMNHMMSHEMASHYLAQQQQFHQQQQQQPMNMQHVQITTTNADGLMDPNSNELSPNGDLTSKSRHISLLKQARKQLPQPRSLSTSTATATSSQHTSPIMRDLNTNWMNNNNNNGNNNMGQVSPLKTGSFGFPSPQTPTVSTPIQHNNSGNNNNSGGQLSGNNNMLPNANATSASQQQPPSLRSTMSGSIFSFSSDHIMDDEDGDVGMLMSTSHNDLSFNSLSSSPYLSPFINTQQRTSTSSVSSSTSDIFQTSSPHNNRNFSLTNTVPPINSLFRDSNSSLQDPFNNDQFNISKQEQRETNQRILEALRSTPLNPVGTGQNSATSYDPLFDSDAFLRGRTSSVSSTDIRLSDSCTTPLTPTEQGRSSFSKISHF